MKLVEIQQGQVDREQSLKASREKSLDFLDIEQHRVFFSTLLDDSYDRDDPYKTIPYNSVKHKDDFIKSLFDQWLNRGSLSEKQVNAVLKQALKIAKAEVIGDMFPNLKVDSVFACKGVVEKIEDAVVESGYGTSDTNKVTVRTDYGIYVSFKTTRQKLLDLANESMSQKKKLKISGKVVWMTPDKLRVSMKAQGIKIEF